MEDHQLLADLIVGVLEQIVDDFCVVGTCGPWIGRIVAGWQFAEATVGAEQFRQEGDDHPAGMAHLLVWRRRENYIYTFKQGQ